MTNEYFDEHLPATRPAFKILTKFYEKGFTDSEIARMIGVNKSTVCRMKKPKISDPQGKDGFINYKYHESFKELAVKLKIKLKAEDFLDG